MAVNPNTDFSSGAVLTAAQQNRFPRGIMAEASRTTSFTGTGTFATVLGCSFTAVANRLYKFTFTCQNAMANTLGNRMQMNFIDDLSNLHGRGYQGSFTFGAVLTFTSVGTLTAGARTINLDAYQDNGGGTALFYADANSPMRLLVEDLGPY